MTRTATATRLRVGIATFGTRPRGWRRRETYVAPLNLAKAQLAKGRPLLKKTSQPNRLTRLKLPLLGSNQDSPDPESGVLPVTPRGKKSPPPRGAAKILSIVHKAHPFNPDGGSAAAPESGSAHQRRIRKLITGSRLPIPTPAVGRRPQARSSRGAAWSVAATMIALTGVVGCGDTLPRSGPYPSGRRVPRQRAVRIDSGAVRPGRARTKVRAVSPPPRTGRARPVAGLRRQLRLVAHALRDHAHAARPRRAEREDRPLPARDAHVAYAAHARRGHASHAAASVDGARRLSLGYQRRHGRRPHIGGRGEQPLSRPLSCGGRTDRSAGA